MNFDIEPLKKEYEEILQEISNPDVISDWEHFETISKRKKRLEIIFEKNEELNRLESQEKENTNILSSEEDTELIQLAESELAIVSAEKEKLRKHLKSLIENIDKEEPIIKEGPVIVEIRAGTGGEEAALFAENLFRMYSRYAQTKGWELNILNSNRTELGGLKEIIFELKNGDVYSFMKYEGGVHRVQRIPETEKGGRIHTSTASVIVMLKPKKGKIKIVPAELKIDTYKASGPGGQYVNKRESAVRITHLPTNTVVTSQTERSLAQNKENAMAILEAKILESIEKEQEEKTKKERKEQVSSSDRPEKIRTYNFPQDRITDHRISKNWSNIEKIMNGNLDPVIEELQKELN
ncbi:MAG: Peptide chain release factor 1 [Parcubacteria group bacterium ADurb.Bin247]|nr:MAG: Peptide chain release factor 1 [Parcubacteria group bacterium ADurb.Bin247]